MEHVPMSTIGVQLTDPPATSSSTPLVPSQQLHASPHLAPGDPVKDEMARPPLSPIRVSSLQQSSQPTPLASPYLRPSEQKPDGGQSRSPVVSQSASRTLAEPRSISPNRSAGGSSAVIDTRRPHEPATDVDMGDASVDQATELPSRALSISQSPTKSPAHNAPGRRESENSVASSGSSRRRPDPNQPLFSTERMNLSSRGNGGAPAPTTAPAREDTVGKRSKRTAKVDVAPDEDEDELDNSDMESEEGAGQRGSDARRVEGDKDTGDFAYEYVPVMQRRENRDKISYELIMRQQPIHARMCGVGDKSDRRPIDPTPIIQLNVIDNVDAEADGRKGPRRPESAGGMSHLQNPYYFLFACLVGPEDDEELHIMDDGKSRYLTGTPVSSLYHVKDENRAEVAFFVFPDLGVRKEGRYKLKLTLFEIVDQEVFYCATTFTEGFTVYSAKKFPGMRKATKLSQVVADQGLRIRVRKDPRKRSSNANARSKRYSDSREPSEELYLHQPKRPRYSADPYLQTAPQEARWARDAGQVMYGQPSQHARMAPPPPPHAVSSHSARQALVTPDGRYQNEAHQLSAYPNQPLRSSGDKSSRGFEQPRQIESRSSQRPTSARPPQSPLSAVHPSMQSGPEVYGMYTSSGRLSSRAAPPPELHISQSQHGRESHRERPRSSLSHQQQPLSAQTTSYAQSYNQHAPPTATSQYSESYGSRHHDIGPPPFSAASTASQPQSMLLPPSTSRSRPQSPLRYDHTVRDHSSRQYGSRGMEELSPQMASTSISRHRHHDETKHDYDHSRREMAPRERYALTKPLASNHGMSLEHGARARDQYGSVSVAGDTDYPPYGTKVDDWRCQQQLHQQAHGGHDIGRHSTSASMSSSGHRRMESNDTTRSSGGGMPSLTLPPLGAVAGHTAMGHGLGHGHAASISRSMTSARPYTPSLGRDSGEGSPATTPGGSKASGNRMGLGHLMD